MTRLLCKGVKYIVPKKKHPRLDRKLTKQATKGQRSLKAKGNSKGARSRKAAPRSQVLPGMEQVRDRTLDQCCEDIGAARDTMNAAKLDEKAAIQRAIKRMLLSPTKTRAYRHGGVELALVEGVDKLRVRLTKEADDTVSTGDGDTESTDPTEELDATGEAEGIH